MRQAEVWCLNRFKQINSNCSKVQPHVLWVTAQEDHSHTQ